MLKPGGVLIITVPFGLQSETIEHFPELNDYTIIEENGNYRLRNITTGGTVQEFRDLVFHGGPQIDFGNAGLLRKPLYWST
jgi:hypothetical protein